MSDIIIGACLAVLTSNLATAADQVTSQTFTKWDYGHYGIGADIVTKTSSHLSPRPSGHGPDTNVTIFVRYHPDNWVINHFQSFAKVRTLSSNCSFNAAWITIKTERTGSVLFSQLVRSGDTIAVTSLDSLPEQLSFEMSPSEHLSSHCSPAFSVFDASCSSDLLIGDRFGHITVVGFALGNHTVNSCPSLTLGTAQKCSVPNGPGIADCDPCKSSPGASVEYLRLRYRAPVGIASPAHAIGRLLDPSLSENSNSNSSAFESGYSLLIYSNDEILRVMEGIRSGQEFSLKFQDVASRPATMRNSDTHVAILTNGLQNCTTSMDAIHIPGCVVARATFSLSCSYGKKGYDIDDVGVPQIGTSLASNTLVVTGYKTVPTATMGAVDAGSCPCKKVSSSLVCDPSRNNYVPSKLRFRYLGAICRDSFESRLYMCNQQFGLGENYSTVIEDINNSVEVHSTDSLSVVAYIDSERQPAEYEDFDGHRIIEVENIGNVLRLELHASGVCQTAVVFSTSCVAPLYVGDKFGPFEVIDFELREREIPVVSSIPPSTIRVTSQQESNYETAGPSNSAIGVLLVTGVIVVSLIIYRYTRQRQYYVPDLSRPIEKSGRRQSRNMFYWRETDDDDLVLQCDENN